MKNKIIALIIFIILGIVGSVFLDFGIKATGDLLILVGGCGFVFLGFNILWDL